MTSTDTIRVCTKQDLAAIHGWLVEEKARGVEGNFLCNWEIIEKCQGEGKLIAYIDGASEEPVAFQLGGLILPGILQVRSDMRGKGIGTRLVEYCIQRAHERNECCLLIECEPPSSVPFWQKMGFKLYGDPGRRQAYRVLPWTHSLPPGKPVQLSISFADALGKDEPIQTSTPAAVLTTDGTVHLAERVSFCKDVHGLNGDVVVAITIEGCTVYSGKAKYPEAKDIGLRRCTNAFYLDSIDSSKLSVG